MKHILLTGKPRTGKTTLIKRIIQDLKSCGGFYTEEVSEGRARTGFRINTLDGEEGVLAKAGLASRFRLGKYGINLKDLEEIGVKAVEKALEEKEIVVIDEIGKMELFSEKFKEVVLKVINSDKKLLGVLHIADLEFLNAIRDRKNVVIFEVTLDNHEDVLRKVRSLL